MNLEDFDSLETLRSEVRNLDESNRVSLASRLARGAAAPAPSEKARMIAVLSELLQSKSYDARMNAALTAGRMGLRELTDDLAAVLRSAEASTGPLDYEAWYVRNAVAFTLVWLRDAKGLPRCIDLLRGTKYFIHATGRTRPLNHRDLHDIYRADQASYLPDANGVSSVSAFLLEDLLVEMGDVARAALLEEINYGGDNNHHLGYALHRLKWSPENPTEAFFFCVTNPERTFEQITNACERFEGFPVAMKAVSTRVLARSLGDTPNWFQTCVRPFVKSGITPIWNEIEREKIRVYREKDSYWKYSPRQYRDLKAAEMTARFCADILRWDRGGPKLADRAREQIEAALASVIPMN